MLIDKSLAYLEQFGKGEFDSFYENVSTEFSTKVPKETFSMRYDKRTYAYPEDFVEAGIEQEYMDDAKAAVQLALQDDRVDGDNLFLAGHSEGGMVGPEICRQNPEIKGFVSLAGTLRRLEDIMLEQNKKALAQDSVTPEEQKKEHLATVEDSVQHIKSLEPKDNETVILGIQASYWNSLNALDGPAIAKQLDIPMLILQGEEDFQVPAEIDYPLWQETLAGNSKAAYKLYPKLNHLFMVGGSKDILDSTVYNVPAHVD